MKIDDLLRPDDVVSSLRVGGKVQLLHELSTRAGRVLAVDAEVILGALQTREALGSTGVGQGIALPHAKIAGVPQPFGMFARLERPIEFDAIDQRPVDLVFLLLAPDRPSTESLAALAAVARQLRDPNVAAQLRAAADRGQIYDALTLPAPPHETGAAASGSL